MTNKDNTNEQHWQLLVLLLKEIADDKGMSQQDIAEATGLKQSNISRMFSLKYCPNLRTFIAVARALKVNLFFEDQEGKTELNQAFERAMEQIGRRPDKLPRN